MGTFGMIVFLVSLSILFTASIVGYLIVRFQSANWPSTALPGGLWLSTLLLLLSSGTMHFALQAARRGRQKALRIGMALTTALGTAFLIGQLFSWLTWIKAGVELGPHRLYAWAFYVFTGLHGAHVIGGLIPLAIVTARAFRGRYLPQTSTGVKHCAMYWHFLDVVWLVLFAVLSLTA